MHDSDHFLRFFDVSFAWPNPETNKVEFTNEGFLAHPVFDAFTADIPSGCISLVGPNGAGKSTFMLLAGGRVLPLQGTVSLLGTKTQSLSCFSLNKDSSEEEITASEHERNLLCSYIYQNMEFEKQGESEQVIGDLLHFVFQNGGLDSKNDVFFTETVKALELKPLLNRHLDALSKGESQRVLLGFSALYGSRVLMMDEPVFALEHAQKEKALAFFKGLAHETGISIMVSLHELALTRLFADTVMLFYPDRSIDMGTCKEVLSPESLEKAYGVPEAMLYDAEKLTQKTLMEQSRFLKGNL